MNSTPTDVLAADCNGVELMTTQRQSFAVAEELGVQAVVARMEADGMVTDGELEEEFQRLCGGEERHSTLEDALDRQQRELAELRAMKKRFEEQELELQRLKGCVELAPGQTEFGTTAAPDWLQRICERDGIDLASAEAQFVTAWRPEETGRSEREFDVSDTMHCLHVEFRCQGQRMPALPGVPSMNLPECNVGSSVVAGDLIPTLPQPAYDHRVENVLEAARVIAIWQGCGSLAEKIRWILDPQQKRITPKSVGLAYAFFRARCMHVAIMASTVPKDGILRHARLTGWQCDTVHILELGWRLSSQSVWNEAVQKSIGFEHRKVLMVVPHNMRSLKRINGFKDTKVFYYREFKEIHLRRTELFDNNIGHVLFVAPTVEPRPGTWLPLVYAAHMWLACGVRLYLLSGPRTHDDNSWFRAAEQLRSHIHGLLEGHQELIPQVIDKLPIANGAVDSCSPCFAVAILEDANALVPERQCRLFYEYCGRQLSRWLSLETIPSSPVPKSNRQTYPHAKEGGVAKRQERRKQQRKRRSELKAIEKGLRRSSF